MYISQTVYATTTRKMENIYIHGNFRLFHMLENGSK